MPRALRIHEVSPFARRLHSVREHFGGMIGVPEITATDFATRLGLSPVAYRRYERGEVDPPMSALAAIRNGTGISLDYLVCGRPNGFDGLLPERVLNSIPVGLRVRWARETQAPGPEGLMRVAHLMGTSPTQWRAYEEDEDPLPLAKAQDVAHRFSVTLDFLYYGRLAGMKEVAPAVLDELLRWHPELLQAQDEMEQAEQQAAHIDRADRDQTGAHSMRPASEYPEIGRTEAPSILPARRC